MVSIDKTRARIPRLLVSTICLLLACHMDCSFRVSAEEKIAAESLTVLVMDPLSAPLACDCVQGYAQRKYERLGAYLQSSLKKPVHVVWSESVSDATKEHGPADILIGKHSVVQFHTKKANQKIRPIAQLSGLDGKVTQTGLIVVRKDDKASAVSDLKDYRILLGPSDCDEKHAAVLALLKSAGIEPPAKPEISSACSEAAATLMELDANVSAAAVISSYAKPLLAGCGTIKKGDLRVIAESKPVPFITAFVNASLSKKDKRAIRTALLDIELEPELMIALETSEGFKKWVNPEPSGRARKANKATETNTSKKNANQSSRRVETDLAGVVVSQSSESTADEQPELPGAKAATNSSWPQWRGSHQDGSTSWLPKTLPEPFVASWSVPLAGDGIGGIAANGNVVVVSGRNLLDSHDIFQCFDQKTGELLWQYLYAAAGELDYGNAPRATPCFFEDMVFTLGAFGHVHCLDLETGLPFWQRNIATDFDSYELTWGHSASPVVVDGKLIVQPGGRKAFLAALDVDTGDTLWMSKGSQAGYSGMVITSAGDSTQLITYDSDSIGGWSTKNGKRLWKIVPPQKGDFNVPTMIVRDQKLLASTENNGTRWYPLNADGVPQASLAAKNEELAPDCHSPVISAGLIFGVWNQLYALDATTLETVWFSDDDAFASYASLIASNSRVLCLNEDGDLLLISTDGARPEIVSRHKFMPRKTRFLSHPAIAGRSLFVRIDKTLQKFDLQPADK